METKNPKSSTQLRFDLINPHAVAYARTHLSDNLGPLKERGREIHPARGDEGHERAADGAASSAYHS
jgi:hypothetical protein